MVSARHRAPAGERVSAGIVPNLPQCTTAVMPDARGDAPIQPLAIATVACRSVRIDLAAMATARGSVSKAAPAHAGRSIRTTGPRSARLPSVGSARLMNTAWCGPPPIRRNDTTASSATASARQIRHSAGSSGPTRSAVSAPTPTPILPIAASVATCAISRLVKRVLVASVSTRAPE